MPRDPSIDDACPECGKPLPSWRHATCGDDICRVRRRRRQYRAAYAGMVERDADRVRERERQFRATPEARARKAEAEAARRAGAPERVRERDRETRRQRSENPDYVASLRRYARAYYQLQMTDERRARRRDAARLARHKRRASAEARDAYNAEQREARRRRALLNLNQEIVDAADGDD